ncbi:MAG: 16S rRNA (adenine(1518)-N(6)/adenine(1519)-N(6))-dimethyltransferase RsmA [Bacteroidia bacterium]|nr:16S rRNA (adenine(1518)-N(6)/adenine(1519)-N(6))-dimethyltransferase RsmA [Bacteroidia bacterium]MDW8346249.1 16S rRNA (adenine(1518)-N(6)/adenine(1519)-N(6))-dimethyltransferase RsmA [Bacteroidia bacterium]
MNVKPKKHLGQHFLRDLSVAKRIADTLTCTHLPVLEIGAGTGVLTQFLIQKNLHLHVVEIDTESVEYLKKNFSEHHFTLYEQDFLTLNMSVLPCPLVWIGNLPYNISSQVLFKLWENYHSVPEAVFMVQKEVAMRIAGSPNSKEYGILSVLLQLDYEVSYEFTVPPYVFNPPPKVYSGVIHLVKKVNSPQYNRRRFLELVRTAFNQRRKILKNSLKTFCNQFVDLTVRGRNVLEYRAENLSPDEFLSLLQKVENE